MIFFQELLVYIPYYLECLLLVWMMLLPYKKKPHYKRKVLLLLIIGVFWQISISSLIYINTSSYEVIAATVKFLLCVFPVYFLYTAYYIKFLKMLYIVVIALLFQRWTSVFADIIVSFTPLSDVFLFGRVIAWLSFGVLALVIWLLYIRLINKDTGAEIDGITILLFVLLFSLFEVFQTIIRAGTDSRVWGFVLSLLELAFGIFMLSQSIRIAERNRKMAERMVSDALLAKERQQFELLKQNMESIKSQAHDLKYIMRAIQTQGLQGDVAGKLHNLVQTYESSFNTGNPALDIILGDAEKNFRSRGIKFECFTDACDLSFMENFDLYSLLGNAFDNAAEYLDTVNEEKRYVSCSVRNENGGFVFIEVSNYYEGERDIYIGIASSKSDKTMHGYGMKNMQRVTEKYGGELQVQAENGAFYVTAVIPCPRL